MQFRPTAEDVQGFLMTAYYGGRTECHYRRVLTRVAYCDVRSMYPTINVLIGLWPWWIAERIELYDATEEVRSFLARVTLNDLMRPDTWTHLPFLILISPRKDRLPVRAPYIEGGDYQVGFNYFTANVPFWFALADVIASKLHTGRPPEVIRALGFRPVGMNPQLQPVRFRGEIEIDPLREDFIKRLVEGRERYRTIAKQARQAGRQAEALHAAAMEAGLKMTANSTAYGISIELNRHTGKSRILRVHGLYAFNVESRSWEQPGRFFYPFVGVMVTAGARLMLTLLELAAKELGADYAMMDTDSLAIAATDAAPDPLDVATAVAEKFTSLNPFSFSGSILKVEDENFAMRDPNDPDKGVDRSRPEPVFYFGVAAKRYALCNVGADGHIRLRKYSEHGLGLYLSPILRERVGELTAPEPDESDNRTELVTPGRGRTWIGEVWQAIIEDALAGRKSVPRFPWSDLPALGRFSVSQPSLYKLTKGWNTVRRGGKRGPKPFGEQVKPTNFLLIAYIDTGTLTREAYRAPRRFAYQHPIRPVAPYDPDPKHWRYLPWCDMHTGEPVKLSWSRTRTYSADDFPVQRYHDVIARYLRHPEAKAAGGDSVGTLGPLHVVVTSVGQIRHIGKESNKLDEVQAVGLQPDTYLHYQDQEASNGCFRETLRRIPREFLAARTGISERQLARLIHGKTQPRKTTMASLLHAVRAWNSR